MENERERERGRGRERERNFFFFHLHNSKVDRPDRAFLNVKFLNRDVIERNFSFSDTERCHRFERRGKRKVNKNKNVLSIRNSNTGRRMRKSFENYKRNDLLQ